MYAIQRQKNGVAFIDHAVCASQAYVKQSYGLNLRKNDRAKAAIPVAIGINGLTGAPVIGNAFLRVLVVIAAALNSVDEVVPRTVVLDVGATLVVLDAGVVLVVVGATVVDVVVGADVDVVVGLTVVVVHGGHVVELVGGQVVELVGQVVGHFFGQVVGHAFGQVVGHLLEQVVGHSVEPDLSCVTFSRRVK